MLKAQEVRIGIFVLEDGDIVQVDAALLYWLINQNHERPSTFSQLSPIPLTPEILEKAGFEHEKGVMSHPVRSMFITTDNVFYLGEVLMVDMQFKVIKIEHVHQLQNLYFALTGNELEINL